MAVMVVYLLVGVALLLIGGNVFVDSAAWLAEKTGVPKVIVGATVVSLATTTPEMIVSFMAASSGNIDIAIGNAIGSATVNMGFILALSAIFMPLAIRRGEILVKVVVMLTAACIVLVFGFTGELGLIPNILLLTCFLAFMAENIRSAVRSVKNTLQHQTRRAEDTAGGRKYTVVNLVKFAAGACCIIIGSRLLVENSSLLAAAIGVSERVIGITIVAIGTSLPELITCATAVIKKQSALSVGNIIGANIVNLALVQPVSALLSGKPLPVSPDFALVDIPFCLLIGCMAFLPTLIKEKLYQAQGVVLLTTYCAYLIYTLMI